MALFFFLIIKHKKFLVTGLAIYNGATGKKYLIIISVPFMTIMCSDV